MCTLWESGWNTCGKTLPVKSKAALSRKSVQAHKPAARKKALRELDTFADWRWIAAQWLAERAAAE
jgi:hypothetical protein